MRQHRGSLGWVTLGLLMALSVEIAPVAAYLRQPTLGPALTATAQGPTNLTAVATSPTRIELAWEPAEAGGQQYLERSTDRWTYAVRAVIGPANSTYVDESVSTCSQYCYRVRVGVGQEAQYSNVTCATVSTEPANPTVTLLSEPFDGSFPPAGWEVTDDWRTQLLDPYDANPYARTSSGYPPGYIQTPTLDCSDAADIAISFAMRESIPEDDNDDWHYDLYFHGRDGWSLAADLTDTGNVWVVRAFSTRDLQYMWENFAVRWNARIATGQRAHLDAVTITKTRAVSEALPTHITQEPADQEACPGQELTYTTAASGEELAYHWQLFDGTAWIDTGVSGPAYTTDPLTPADSGRLVRAAVSGACGTAFTHPARIGVLPAVPVAFGPEQLSVCPGSSAQLQVSAIGEALTYRWEFDGGVGFEPLSDGEGIQGTLSPVLQIQTTDENHVGLYRAVVTSACGTTITSSAQLSLLAPPRVLTHPQDRTVDEGSPADLAVLADGDALSYRWEVQAAKSHEYVALDAPDASTLTTWALDAQADHDALLRCRVAGACGEALSEPARLTVLRRQLIPLSVGWSAISLSVRPTDPAIDAVLADLLGRPHLVYGWANGAWLIHDPASAPASTLTHVDETMGLWIHVDEPLTLGVRGLVPQEPTRLSLEDGWSLVSYPAAGVRALPEALSAHGLAGDWLLYGYRPDAPGYWARHSVGAPAWANTLAELIPGRAYWVQLQEPADWHVPYD